MIRGRLRLGIWWALPAFICFFVFLAIATLYASGTNSAFEDKQVQDKEKKKDKNAQEKQSELNIKVDVSLVTIDVTLIGNPASELKKEDFVIYDNGVSQPVTHFSQDKIPIAVALLIDNSLNIRLFLPQLQFSGLLALRNLKADDQVVLYSSSLAGRRRTDLTDDRIKIADSIGMISVESRNGLLDALVDASDYLRKMAPDFRQVIITITDNSPGQNSYSPVVALNHLMENSTALHCVRAVDTRLLSELLPVRLGIPSSQFAIWDMLNYTGGSSFDAIQPTSLPEALRNAITHIRNEQYTLGFSPSNPEKDKTYHKLEVQLASKNRCPACRIQARKGYYSGVLAPPASPAVAKKPVRTQEETDDLIVRRIITAIATSNYGIPGIQFSNQYADIADAEGEHVRDN
jgi:Ca-activated chloride channel homolog